MKIFYKGGSTLEFLIFTLLNVTLILLALTVYDGILLRRTINNNISYAKQKYTPKEENIDEVEDTLSSYEMERIAREREFDRRIALLKQEIGYENKQVGYIADELDPNVYNLPHESVSSLINVDVDEVAR